jgi:leucine dehydrogenase
MPNSQPIIEELFLSEEHERVFRCRDAGAGYLGFIAIHSTVAGPAVGGTRLWRYGHEADALSDVLRLSRGMTYKTAIAGIPLGGGKSVIVAPANGIASREALFRAHGRFIERLEGRYITAEDVGTSPEDMAIVRQETVHVAGLPDGMGDPGPFTARGVHQAMCAAALHRWGSESLRGRTVVIQGCGNVGYQLALMLCEDGARLVVSDLDPTRLARAVDRTGAEAVSAERVLEMPGDIFAPCALGGVLGADVVARLAVSVVVGAANNQLADADAAGQLASRGILYGPDYVANAGGVLSGCGELLGWTVPEVERRIHGIRETMLDVFHRAERDNVSPATAADQIAEERLRLCLDMRKKDERRRDATRSGRS